MHVTDRKPRADAWYAGLNDEQQAQIYDRARRFPWFEVIPWIETTFSIPKPGKSAFYGFCEYFAEHEQEYLLRQRLRDRSALEREFAQVGATDAGKLAAVLSNDVAAARAKGDDQAVARAIRAYQTVAKIVGDTRTFDLKVQEFEQAKRDFALRQQDMDLKLRRLELYERKLAEAQATGASVDPKALADEVDRILGRRAA